MVDAGRADLLQREMRTLAQRGLGLIEFMAAVGQRLQPVVPYDITPCCFTMDPSTMLLTGHVNESIANDPALRARVVRTIAESEYREPDVNRFSQLATRQRPVNTLQRATGGRPERSARYRRLLRDFEFDDELRLAFVIGSSCWGGMALYRHSSRPSFDPREVALMASIAPFIGQGVRTALLLAASTQEHKSAGPGLVLLDGDDRPLAVSPPARRWLADLIEPGSLDEDNLPQAVLSVAARARSQGIDGTGGASWARVPTRTGRWLILHGTLLERGGVSETAVIVEPALRGEMAPLLLDAYSLSAREQEVVRLVLRGLGTADIAAALFVSPYTVQDHLKSIFEKVEVRSRRELTAKLFFDHYYPWFAGGDPGAWFSSQRQEEQAG